MSIGSARIGAQPAAHFKPRQIVHHPVDEGPHRPFNKTPRAFRAERVKGEAALIVDKILKALAQFAGEENIDDIHVQLAPVRYRGGAGV